MKLQINGEAREFNPPLTLAGLLDQLDMKADRVAVELNRSIVPREQWQGTSLADGDRLEIVHFVGGGHDSQSPFAGTRLVTPSLVKSTVDTCLSAPKMFQTFGFVIV